MSFYVGKKLLLPLLVFLAWGALPAWGADFNAFWQYRESGGEGIETRRSFQQRYSLGAGTGLSFQPTHAISAGFNLGYTRTDRDSGTGMASTEDIVPSANLNLTNDIFRASLFGTATESRQSTGDELSARSWDLSLGSNWERTFWPNVWLNYGESTDETRDRAGIVGAESKTSRYGLGADWDLVAAQLFYAFSHTESDDRIAGARSEADSHFARVETGGTFWQNRLNVRLSQQYQHTVSDFSAEIPEDGIFLRRLEGVTLSAVVDPVQVPEADLVEPSPNPLLGNDDREGLLGVAESIPPLHVGHFGIRFDFDVQIDLLHLYVDPFTFSPDQVAALRWDLYTRSLIDSFWEPVAQDLSVTFNSVLNRFEIPVSRRDREVKVVVTNLSGLALNLTELDAIEIVTEDIQSRQQSHLTSANMRIRLTRTLSAASSISLERTDSRSGEVQSESTRRTLSGSLRWTPTPMVTPSVGYSESRQDTTGQPEALIRSYSLTVATFPLPTLNVSAGTTRSERYLGSRKTASSDSYSLISTARIYPDLTAALNATYVTSSRETADGGMSDVDTFSSRLNLNARLHPTLTADLTANYRETETAAAATSSSDSTLSFAYRPSDLLSMRLTGTRRWSGPDTPDTLAYNLHLALLRTQKTRVTFRYSHTQGAQTVNNFGLDGNWNINPSLALQTRGNYTLAERDSWNFQVSLALRL